MSEPAAPKSLAQRAAELSCDVDTRGMLFVNRASWAHVLEASAPLLGTPPDSWLAQDELAALRGEIPLFPTLDFPPRESGVNG